MISRRQWRHTFRETTYVEVGRAELEASKPPRAGSSLVIYQDQGGRLWAREEMEFEDGSFVELDPWRPEVPPDAQIMTLPPGSKLTIGSNGCTVTLPGY